LFLFFGFFKDNPGLFKFINNNGLSILTRFFISGFFMDDRRKSKFIPGLSSRLQEKK